MNKGCYQWKLLFPLLVVLILCVLPVSALASSGGPQAQSQTQAGGFYDVSTALTAYANRVVGVNANEKHSDQRLSELSGCGAGVAGGVVGYGDVKNGFFAYIASEATVASTASSYVAWSNVGDDGSCYAYVRYGRLMADLGLDEVGPVQSGGNFSVRSIFGTLTIAMFNIGGFVPALMNFLFKLLRLLNPFVYMIGADTTYITSSALKSVITVYQTVYNGCFKIGYGAVIILFVFVMAYILMTRRNDKSSKFFNWVKRFVFIIAGIPFMGALYTSCLEHISANTLASPKIVQVVASVLHDFEFYAYVRRLSPMFDVKSVKGKSKNESSADAKTVRNLRENIFSSYLGVGSAIGSGTSFGKHPILLANYSTGDWNVVTAGSVSDDAGQLHDRLSWRTLFDHFFRADDVATVTELLERYRDGNMYQAASWAGAVGSYFLDHGYEMGHAGDNQNADSNDNTINGMFSAMDEPDDWENREVSENKNIFAGNKTWSGANIVGRGSSMSETASPNSNVTYTDRSGIIGALGSMAGIVNINSSCGMTPLAVYNYLLSEFTDSQVVVHSPRYSATEFSQKGHYSVTLIGSGFLRVAYAISVTVSLFIIALFGYLYTFGMLVSSVKRSFQILFQIPFASMGVLRSIVQVVTYFVLMICELFFTMLLYDLVVSLVYGLSSLFADIFVNAMPGIVGLGDTSSYLFNARFVYCFAVLFGALLIRLLNYELVKHRRALLCGIEYVWCMIYRFASFGEMKLVFDTWLCSRASLYVWDVKFIPVLKDVFDSLVNVGREGCVDA